MKAGPGQTAYNRVKYSLQQRQSDRPAEFTFLLLTTRYILQFHMHGAGAVAVLGFTLGVWGGHNCSWGARTYCHSEPPLISGKLCFIINFIGVSQGEPEFLLGEGEGPRPPGFPFKPPLCRWTDWPMHCGNLIGCPWQLAVGLWFVINPHNIAHSGLDPLWRIAVKHITVEPLWLRW